MNKNNDTYAFKASIESLSWDWRLTVYYPAGGRAEEAAERLANWNKAAFVQGGACRFDFNGVVDLAGGCHLTGHETVPDEAIESELHGRQHIGQ